MSIAVEPVRIRRNVYEARQTIVMQVKGAQRRNTKAIVRRDTGRKSKHIKEAWKAT